MAPEIIEFVGRMHLMLVHLPLGLVTGALVAELLLAPSQRRVERQWRALAHKVEPSQITGWRRPGSIALGMLALGLVGAIGAGATGWIYADNYGQGVDLHRWLGVGATGAIALATLLALAARNAGTSRMLNIYRVGLLLAAGSVAAAGHWGASLVHGEGVRGEGYVFEPLARLMGVTPESAPREDRSSEDRAAGDQSPRAQEAPVNPDRFATVIAPALERSCIQCHGPDRQRGRLRLDSIEQILEGRKQVVARGAPGESELVFRIELHEDDPDAMPPKGEAPRLTPEEVMAIRDWIAGL